MFTLENYNMFLAVMAVTALIVFIALYFVKAGYGYLYNPKFGFPVPNKVAWVLMESPVFVAMAAMWWFSSAKFEVVPLILFLTFELHYFQRSFIFPLLMRGDSKMPLGIVLMGMTFNTFNAYVIGEWVSTATKAWVPSVFVTAVVMLIGYWTVIPTTVVSDSNLTPEHTLADVLDLVKAKGHSTVAITEDGSSTGKLLGIVTGRDYRVSRMDVTLPVITRFSGKDWVFVSIVHGIVVDFSVPFLVPLFCSL